MKQSDFDRLKAVCEKEGFELLNESANDNDKFFVLKKAKDIWEGVEFALSLTGNEIFRMDELRQKMPFDCITYNFKPSTELAYIEKLKAEAFKRFGEIKEGETFVDAYSSQKIKTTNGFIKMYNKHIDCFAIGGVVFYSKSKWATRVKERVKVEPNIRSINDFASKLPENQKQELKEIIALKLEEYLNKESE